MFARELILDFDGRRFQGVRPFALFESQGGAWTWQCERADSPFTNFPFHDGRGDVCAEIQRALRWCRTQSPLGAAIGFWSYEFARHLEPRAFLLPALPDLNQLRVPDVRLVFCEELEESPIPSPDVPPLEPRKPRASVSAVDARYLSNIARIKEYIAAGDIYQANLVRPFSTPLKCAPKVLYEHLRATHPTPFGAYLEWDGFAEEWKNFAIVSNSPERFVRLRGRELLTQPIKGTIGRGNDPEQDARLREQLQHSIKDRAENVMIVDLLRNDLGRVCEYGSVQVPQLWEVQTFATLHHLVSTVQGTLRREYDGVDALKVLFPCGSITGAPKIRAMQIIEELERAWRGVSMGAIGYFGFGGDMEWNVAIRTLTCIGGTAYGHAGGGIVWDSDAASEYQEMLLKRRAMESALAACYDGQDAIKVL